MGWDWEGAGVGGHSPRGTPGIFFEKFIKIIHFSEKICSPLTLDRNNNKINVRSYHGLLGVKDIALTPNNSEVLAIPPPPLAARTVRFCQLVQWFQSSD